MNKLSTRLLIVFIALISSYGMLYAFGFGGGGGGSSTPNAQPGIKGKGTGDGTSITVVDGVFSATGVAAPISIQPYSNVSTAIRGKYAQTGAQVAGDYATNTTVNTKVAYGNYSNGSLIRGIADPGGVEYVYEIADHTNACPTTLRHGIVCFDRQTASSRDAGYLNYSTVHNVPLRDAGYLNYSGHDHATGVIATNMTGNTTWWQSVKSTLKTYFDTLYHGLTVTWSEITGKPTTVATSGLTDAKTTTAFSTYSGNRAGENIVPRYVNFSTNHATGGGGSMTYPGTGVANSTGSTWGTSYGVSTVIGTPGVDTNLATEKAVRDAVAGGVSGVSSVGVTAPITSSGAAGSPTIGLGSVPFGNWTTGARSNASSARSVIGAQAAGSYLTSSSTLDATKLSGNLPAISGASLTGITPTVAGLSNVTNDVQTKNSIVPNTAPSAGQLLVGNAGGTAYAPVTVSGDCTTASTGAITCTKINGKTVSLAGNLTTTGAYNTSFTQQGSYTITLPPASLTMATITGTETLTNKTLTAPEMHGEFYDVGSSSPSTTGSVTLDASAIGAYELTPTGTTTQTIAFTGNPASTHVRYVNLHITTAGSGVTTLAWPSPGSTFGWIGPAGVSGALTASKEYEYACEVGATKTRCMAAGEAY